MCACETRGRPAYQSLYVTARNALIKLATNPKHLIEEEQARNQKIKEIL